MIGSETLALAEDPPAITLDSKTLDSYAGSYQAAPDMKITLSRQGSDLMASLNGGPATVQKVQARDIIFSPGRGQTPKVFQRDAHGNITGFIYLRGNHSLIFQRIG